MAASLLSLGVGWVVDHLRFHGGGIVFTRIPVGSMSRDAVTVVSVAPTRPALVAK